MPLGQFLVGRGGYTNDLCFSLREKDEELGDCALRECHGCFRVRAQPFLSLVRRMTGHVSYWACSSTTGGLYSYYD